MENFVDPYKLFPDVCDTRWYEEQRAKKHLSPWKEIYLLKCLFLSTLRSQETIQSFAQKLSNYLVDSYNLFLNIWQVRQKEKKTGQKLFFTGKFAFFFETWSSTTNYVRNKCSYNFQSKCQKSLWTLMKCSIMFVKLGDTRKNGTNTFVIMKLAIFWDVCFCRRLRCQRDDLIICTRFVIIPCEPL